MRAGAQTLTLLGAPRNFLILRALAEGPKGQLDLRRAAGSPAQSTLRGHLRKLEASGALARRQRNAFPGTLEYELTVAGQELLTVAERLVRWLECAPSGALEPGTDPAKAAVKGLVDGWLARILTPLAESPLSLTELDRHVTAASYPTIERRLETMRLADQVETRPRAGGGTPYALTGWLRQGVTPLTFATRWEHRHQPAGSKPLTRREIESILAIARPLVPLPPGCSGLCQVAVRVDGGKTRDRELGFVELRDGAASFGEVCPERKPDAWASGTSEAWFAALLDAEPGGLRISGDRRLLDTLLDSAHDSVFARGDDQGALEEPVHQALPK